MAERKVAKDGGGDGTPQQRLDRAIRDGTVQEPDAGNGPYHCKICQKQLKNKETIKSHLTTPTHMKKANESTGVAKGPSYTKHNAQANTVDTSQADELSLAIQNGQVTEVDKGDSYHCKVCNKNLTKGGIRRHVSSQTHNSKLPKLVSEHDGTKMGRTSRELPKLVTEYDGMTMGRTGRETSWSSGDEDDEPDVVGEAFAENVLQELNDIKGKYWCSVCNQHLKIYNRLANHLRSQKHSNKLPLETTSHTISKTCEESSGPSEGEDETDPVNNAFNEGVLVEYKGQETPYYCNICLQPLKIYGRLSNHLQSKKHKQKVGDRFVAVLEETDWKVDTHEFEYYRDYKSKGRVHVFNVLLNRPGAKTDSDNIHDTFTKMDYEVFIHEDFTQKRFLTTIKDIQEDETMKDVGALIIFILSHGINIDTFITYDEKYMSLDKVKRNFTNKRCPHLKGKPKIIWANFCRGNYAEADSPSSKEVAPSREALLDMIIVHSSNEGIIAQRHETCGTPFVVCLCTILREDPKEPKCFRDVFMWLYIQMKKCKGTTPMAVDHIFKKFTF